MMEGDRQIPQDLFNLREDFEAFRKSTAERLNYLEDNLPQEFKAEARRMRMAMEIDDFRAGR